MGQAVAHLILSRFYISDFPYIREQMLSPANYFFCLTERLMYGRIAAGEPLKRGFTIRRFFFRSGRAVKRASLRPVMARSAQEV
jgi:hypothetical protein